MNSMKTLHSLREALHKKFGSITVDRQLCEQISVAIFTHQEDYISTTTLMRLFGLLPMDRNVFPPQIIEMIVRYTGHQTDGTLDALITAIKPLHKTPTRRI
ncbi:hypothetical protein [Pedobacter sp. BMA]|uniref:hypothetical protein n=1 Tax=Pedobacter sp. BMA TaxID=1663685 RepID=UPI000649D759|nr:hypothetical protein [Pedobacter sp. BMA]KLT63768.1 hypothetical protein AB669_20195 [Pedobacter sp. BMA]